MKVLLISANTEKINILPFPLGLNCVAAATISLCRDKFWTLYRRKYFNNVLERVEDARYSVKNMLI